MKYESYVCNNCGKYINSFYTCTNCYNTIMNNLILPRKYSLGDKVYYLNIYPFLLELKYKPLSLICPY